MSAEGTAVSSSGATGVHVDDLDSFVSDVCEELPWSAPAWSPDEVVDSLGLTLSDRSLLISVSS